MIKCFSWRLAWLLAINLCMTAAAFSQDQKMYPDRPDQTEEVHVVAKGRFQLESGIIINRFDSGRNAIINKTILRYGISKKIELGLLSEQGRDRNRYLDETVQSAYPLALRSKIILLQKHSWLPDMTLVNYFQLPLAKDDDKARAKPSISTLIAFLTELSDKWRLDYTGGFQQEAFSNRLGWQVFTSLHYDVTENLEAFGGTYSQFQNHEKPFHNLNAGLAFMLMETLQIDVAAGTSVGHDDGNAFLTIGFAYLF